MTEITPETLWARLEQEYGSRLAHPDHHPRQFNQQAKLTLYYWRQELAAAAANLPTTTTTDELPRSDQSESN